VLETIGKGGFSTVYKCSKNTSKNDLFAIKKIALNLKKQTKKTKEEVESALREIIILEKMNHENIVQYNSSWIEVVVSEVILFFL
jgi:serine/threonine protein kinase